MNADLLARGLKVLSNEKPASAVTDWIERLSSDKYEVCLSDLPSYRAAAQTAQVEAVDGLVELIERYVPCTHAVSHPLT